MSLEKAIKEDLPELLKLLKAKFSSSPTSGSTSKTFKSDNGELFYEGELAIGTDIFTQHNPEQEACILKEKKSGKTKEEAEKICMSSGKTELIAAPTKTYKHEDGTELVVESGKVVDIIRPADQKMSAKEIAEEIFKTFPKTDLSAIETTLAEFKTMLAAISTEKAELKAKVDKFDAFKTEVIEILEKFSKTASVPPASTKKTNSSKNIFNPDLTFENRIELLQKQNNF